MLRAPRALRSSKDPRALLVGGASPFGLREWSKVAIAAHTSAAPESAPRSRGASPGRKAAPPRLESPPVAGLLPEQRAVLDRWRSLSHALGGGSENQSSVDVDIDEPARPEPAVPESGASAPASAAVVEAAKSARTFRDRFDALHALCSVAEAHLSASEPQQQQQEHLRRALDAIAEAALYEDALMLEGLVERCVVPAIFTPGEALTRAIRAPCASEEDELARAVAAQFQERVLVAVLRSTSARQRMRGAVPEPATAPRLRAIARRDEARAAAHADGKGDVRLRSSLLTLAAQIMRDAGDDALRWGTRLDAAIAVWPENVCARVQRACSADLELDIIRIAMDDRNRPALLRAATACAVREEL